MGAEALMLHLNQIDSIKYVFETKLVVICHLKDGNRNMKPPDLTDEASHAGHLSRNSSRKHGRLPTPLSECAEMANHGSGIIQRGSHAGGATKPILADLLKGIIHRAGAKMGRKKEDSEAHPLWKMAQKAGKEEARVAFYPSGQTS